jgi:hypothetical protein
MRRVNLVIATVVTFLMVWAVPLIARDGLSEQPQQLRPYPAGAQQVAQDDSNDNGAQANPPSDDSSDNSDNSGSGDMNSGNGDMNAQPGDDSGGDSSQMNSAPGDDTGNSSDQTNSDSGDSQGDQSSGDSQ